MSPREQGLRRGRAITVGLTAVSVLGAGGIAVALDVAHNQSASATSGSPTTVTDDPSSNGSTSDGSASNGSSSSGSTSTTPRIGSAQPGSRHSATSSGS